MKKILSASLAAALLGGGLVLATASSASAATVPDESCQAVYETQPNPDYIPEVPEISHVEVVVDTPEVPEVSHTEYLWKSWNWDTFQFDYRWSVDNPGTWWVKTGQTRVVVDTPYQPAVTHEETVIDQAYQPAVGEPTIQVQTGEHCEVWVTWQTTFLTENPQGANDVTWPQSFIGIGQIAPVCDQQVQQDRYVGSREAIDAILADDTLDGLPPEDSGVVTSWALVDGGVCAPEPNAPDVVVSYGEFGGDTPTCEVPEVTWTRERTTVTTPYVVVGDPHSGWSQVLDTENATTVVDTDEVTEVHSYDGDCTPPATEQPTPPAKASSTDELAYTGADLTPLWVALGGLIAGAVLLLVRRLTKA